MNIHISSPSLLNFFALATILSFLLFPAAAQNEPAFVDFTVQLNGQKIPPPDHVTLTIANHSVDVPVRDGRFQLPQEIAELKIDSPIAFRAIIGADKIELKLMRGKFDDRWTLILEDYKFAAEYNSILKGKKAMSACVLIFNPKPHPDETQPTIRDATELIAPQCRIPLKK